MNTDTLLAKIEALEARVALLESKSSSPWWTHQPGHVHCGPAFGRLHDRAPEIEPTTGGPLVPSCKQ